MIDGRLSYWLALAVTTATRGATRELVWTGTETREARGTHTRRREQLG